MRHVSGVACRQDELALTFVLRSHGFRPVVGQCGVNIGLLTNQTRWLAISAHETRPLPEVSGNLPLFLKAKLCHIRRFILATDLLNISQEAYSFLVAVRINSHFIFRRSERYRNSPDGSTNAPKNRRYAILSILLSGKANHHASHSCPLKRF